MTRSRPSRRSARLICGLLLALVAVPAVLTWRERQQETLNRELIEAVRNDKAPAVARLLRQGADPNTFATPQRELSLWRLLRERLRGRTATTHAGTPALILAVTRVPSPYVDQAGYASGVTIVKALLERGAYINIQSEAGVDLMNLAVESDYDLQILRLLLAHRANVNRAVAKHHPPLLESKNPLNGRTPLMTAAGWGDPATVNLLLGGGANVDAQTEDGRTALMYAVDKGRPDTIACLLAHRANVRVKDRHGDSALSLAQASHATNKVTPFTHEVGTDFWPHIVRMLEHAVVNK